MQVGAIHRQGQRGIDRERVQVPLGRLAEHARIEDLAHEAGQREGLGHGLFAPAEGEHVTDHALDAARVVVDDSHQAHLHVGALLLAEQFGGLGDRLDSGLRISCAMLAVRRPSAASLICCNWRWISS